MNAVISGQSGVAVLLDGVRLASIHAGSDEAPVDRSPGEVRFLLGDARDLEFLEDTAPEEVRDRLEVASSKYDALHLALILLDRELSHDTRRTAAEELDELLAEDVIARSVESVLYAHPLPRSGDLAGARSACTGRTGRTRAFLGKLDLLQPVIAEIHKAWERVPMHLFGTDEDRRHFLSTAVKEGLFRDLAIRAAARATDDFVSSSLTTPAVGGLANARKILQLWVEGCNDPVDVWAAPPVPPASYVAEDTGRYHWENPDDDEELSEGQES